MDRPIDRRRVAGNSTGSLALLLAVLLGLGAWNYHRNYQLERESARERPYSGYSDRDVSLLRDAVFSELQASRERFERARKGRMSGARDRGSVGDNAVQFNRTTRASNAIRDAASVVAQQEATLAALDAELAHRAGIGDGAALHLRRLTSF
ncbi:MAG: hypothetical protein R3F21_07365 [Myxococcota bacterium]